MGLIKFFSPVMYWIFSFCLLHNDGRQLDGYKFPVNTTPFCPRNETEWNERSFAMNCTESNGYTCLPNQDLTEILEFCYIYPFIWIEDGVCLYLLKGVSRVNAYDCHHFRYGCHNSSFPSNKIFEHPACISIGNGCFLAEESCASLQTTTYLPETTEDVQKDNNLSNHKNNWVWIVTLFGVALLVCISVMCTLYRYRKQRHDKVSNCNAIEEPLIVIKDLHGTELVSELPPEDRKKSLIKHKREEIEPLLDSGLDTVESIKEDPSSVTFDPSSVIKEDPSSVTFDPSSGIKEDPSSVTFDQSSVTIDPSSVTSDPSFVTPDPSSVTPDPSSVNTNKDSIDKDDKVSNCNAIEEPLIVIKDLHGTELVSELPPEDKKKSLIKHKREEIKPLLDSGLDTVESIKEDPSSVTFDPSSVIKEDPSSVTFDQSSVTIDPSSVTSDPSFVTPDPSSVTPDPSSVNTNKDSIDKESPEDKAIFDQWQQNDNFFIQSKACEEVERKIEIQSPVIVTGHSGSGKSAIIQHIALKYRECGWSVRPTSRVEDIVNAFPSNETDEKKLFVLNDPIGKESFDEIEFGAWSRYQEALPYYFKKSKVLISCRRYIILDSRLKGPLKDKTSRVDVNDDQFKFSREEKRQIFEIYKVDVDFTKEESDEILQIEAYFPLLCKLYSSKTECHDKGVLFFKEPVIVLEEEIRGFRNARTENYCSLILLVFFNNDLCINSLLENESKYTHALKLCGMKQNTAPFTIRDSLDSLDSFLVKKIGDKYHFYHDLVMEVTNHVFGMDYPTDMLKYADIEFLRKKVRLDKCKDYKDSFTIYLSNMYLKEFAERLYQEIFEKRFLEALLHPCLKNEKIINLFQTLSNDHQYNLKMLLEKRRLDFQDLDQTSRSTLHLSKLLFVKLENELSPMFAISVFCHTEFSKHCLHTLQKMQINLNHNSLFSAVCCNGSSDLFYTFFKDLARENLSVKWGSLYPIHIVSAFHNYEILHELIKCGANVNLKIKNKDGWTPLMVAVGNEVDKNEDESKKALRNARREKTVQVLLKYGADINLCNESMVSPLYVACDIGNNNIVHFLMSHEADVNACMKDGTSPLFAACRNGHVKTIQLLLDNGADINICLKDKTSLLYIACQNGHRSTVKILLDRGVNVNLCKENGTSPLYIACQNMHDKVVQLLLNNKAEINSCRKNGASPLYITCFHGYYSTMQILLSHGANVNLCIEDGTSPLFVACENGHHKSVQLLLSNRADINLCPKKDVGRSLLDCEISPLHIACKNRHDGIVKLLLDTGANQNVPTKNGKTPLFIACARGNVSTLQLLLSYKADINLSDNEHFSPLGVACEKGNDNIVDILLSNKIDINYCTKHGESPLFLACAKGHQNIVQQLLRTTKFSSKYKFVR